MSTDVSCGTVSGLINTGRFELFLDLLYVAILANFAESIAEHISGAQLVKYIVSHECSSPNRNPITNSILVDSSSILARLE